MKKKQKSQTQIVFLIILGVILIFLIFFFGFKSIKSFQIKSSEISDINLVETLKSDFSRLKSQDGNIETAQLSTSNDIEYACFIDWSAPSFPPIPIKRDEILAFISIEEKQDINLRNNFILVGKNNYLYKRFEGFITDSKVICKSVKEGRFELSIEGKGNGVRLF